jgi:hypothetical protein
MVIARVRGLNCVDLSGVAALEVDPPMTHCLAGHSLPLRHPEVNQRWRTHCLS